MPWTSWDAAKWVWSNSAILTGEASGAIRHEVSHAAFRIGDNYNNPYVTPYRRVGSGPWDLMDRGSFNGPGGPHKRYLVPKTEGDVMSAGIMLRQKVAWNFVTPEQVLTVSRDGLAKSGLVVAKVMARAVDPAPGSGVLSGVVVSLDGATNPAQPAAAPTPAPAPANADDAAAAAAGRGGAISAVGGRGGAAGAAGAPPAGGRGGGRGGPPAVWSDRTPVEDPTKNPLWSGTPDYNFYSVEVVQRMGYDAYCPDSGVLLAKNKDQASAVGGPNSFSVFNWVIDAHPEDIDKLDFKRPNGEPVMRTIADYRQLNDALFHAGTNSGSQYEWTDEPNRLHFYVIDREKDAKGVLTLHHRCEVARRCGSAATRRLAVGAADVHGGGRLERHGVVLAEEHGHGCAAAARRAHEGRHVVRERGHLSAVGEGRGCGMVGGAAECAVERRLRRDGKRAGVRRPRRRRVSNRDDHGDGDIGKRSDEDVDGGVSGEVNTDAR